MKVWYEKYAAAILMVLSIIFYGLFTGVQKDGLRYVDNPFEFACYTMLFSSILLFPFIIKPLRKNPKQLFNRRNMSNLILLALAVQVLAASLKLFALKETTATSVGFVASFSSVFLTIYAVIINKEKLPKGFILALLIMVFGLVLFKTNANLTVVFGIGEILTLIFINITSSANAVSKKLVNFSSPFVLSFGRLFFAIVPLAVLTYLTGDSLDLSSMFSKYTVLAGLLFGMRVMLLYMAISITKVHNIAVFNVLGPLVTYLYAFTFLGERLESIQFIGALIIILGGFIIYKIKLIEKQRHIN